MRRAGLLRAGGQRNQPAPRRGSNVRDLEHILADLKDWADFERAAAGLPAKQKGDFFELLTKLYLLVDPVNTRRTATMGSDVDGYPTSGCRPRDTVRRLIAALPSREFVYFLKCSIPLITSMP
jgi:hypothetical protein